MDKVSGYINDSDWSPWCTTAGACQETFSQIPRTCCKGVTEFDYQSASSTCHSSVNVGEYHEKVYNRMLLLKMNLIKGVKRVLREYFSLSRSKTYSRKECLNIFLFIILEHLFHLASIF